jgi:hypothetical protein
MSQPRNTRRHEEGMGLRSWNTEEREGKLSKSKTTMAFGY